jgi:hypothetical protein
MALALGCIRSSNGSLDSVSLRFSCLRESSHVRALQHPQPVGRIKGALVLRSRLLIHSTHPNPTKGGELAIGCRERKGVKYTFGSTQGVLNES